MALLAAGGSILKRVFLPRNLQPDEIATFHAFLDTLIPGGAGRTGFPGALATTIGPRLLSEATNRRARRALVEGIELLDRGARGLGADSFSELSRARREAVIATLAGAPEGSLPRFFYRSFRDRSLELHYAHPAVRHALSSSPPPQPRGYLDYRRAPSSAVDL